MLVLVCHGHLVSGLSRPGSRQNRRGLDPVPDPGASL
jgi:hypothetical protein